MAKAGNISIVESEHIGSLQPESVHLPGVYVDRVVKSEINLKPIEKNIAKK